MSYINTDRNTTAQGERIKATLLIPIYSDLQDSIKLTISILSSESLGPSACHFCDCYDYNWLEWLRILMT